MIRLINGDSFLELDKFEDNYFSSCVTDPPYELTQGSSTKGFMGNEWDGTGIQRNPEFWKKVLRVMKPGSFLLAFGGTRTFYRTAVAIEDAGFLIKDTICWLQGQGFPKSHNLGNGWGTLLKPAFEPIIMAQKPISEKSIGDNFKKWGTGGINIDESRIELNGEIVPINKLENWSGFGQEQRPDYEQELNTKGRWPANLILDETAGKMLDEQSGITKSSNAIRKNKNNTGNGVTHGLMNPVDSFGFSDIGGASRFFYCAKANKKEKEIDGISHPTTKPISLMEYLVRLVTPKNGIVLDPFSGGFSTMIACNNLGFDGVGIEKEKKYYNLGKLRVEKELQND